MKIRIIILMLLVTGCSSVSSSNVSDSFQTEISYGKVTIGMTQEQVRKMWGDPRKITRKVGKDFDEVWVYVPHWKFKNYLYFKDGVLVRGNPNPENLI